ncbi:UNVERIFIED_CONTAM: hypothetical protein C4Z64_02080 [Clostridioides difficile]
MYVNLSKKQCEKIQSELKEGKNNSNSNYLSLIENDGKIEVSLLNSKEVLFVLKKEKFVKDTFIKNNIFDYRNNFIGEFVDEKLKVITCIRLHGHTEYSLLDSIVRIEDLVQEAEYSCSITDHGVMYGSINFYKQMISQNKKPIIGFEAYSESIDGSMNKNHLVLLAKDEVGYKNISKLCSMAYNNFYKRPQVKYSWLEEYNKGVIVLSGCIAGEIPRAIADGNNKLAEEVALKLKEIFKNDFYIEIQRHDIKNEGKINKNLISLAKKLDIKVVATDDAHYLKKEDFLIHETHLCNQTKTTMDDPKRYKFSGTGYHVHSCIEMEEKYKDIPEVLFNTLEIMDKCNLNFDFGNNILPVFPREEEQNLTDEEYFKKLCYKGFKERFYGSPKYESFEYKERLEYEIKTICEMGYPDYFLIVWDFINFAKKNNIPIGPGRGSCVGSLVAYVLKITEMDPIRYDLLFERFLNPDRISMPDIDVDIGDERRDEVINYVRKKYGKDRVSKIITFGRMGAKGAINDTARIWGKSTSFRSEISKLIPLKPNITIDEALEESTGLKQLYDGNLEVREIIDKAKKIEGLPKSKGVHACGIIIARESVTNFCPQIIVKNKDTGEKEWVTQYTMGECESIGLLKMDFLGLKTMTILSECIDDINKNYNKNLKINNIPVNDIEVYEHIFKGDTRGVFQLEGPGMTGFMKNLFQDVPAFLNTISNSSLSKEQIEKKKEEFGDVLFERLIAGISLYRPGPMEEIPNYINNMINPEQIHYDTPELESILKNTYGIIIYQEQVSATRFAER